MLESKAGRRVKLIDFGLSCSVTPGRLLTNFCGSLDYAAPEVLGRRPYDGRAADCFALGVLLFTMVVGVSPFVDRAAAERAACSPFEDRPSVETSPEFRDLIDRLLERDPRRRLTIHGVMAHPWTDYCSNKH